MSDVQKAFKNAMRATLQRAFAQTEPQPLATLLDEALSMATLPQKQKTSAGAQIHLSPHQRSQLVTICTDAVIAGLDGLMKDDRDFLVAAIGVTERYPEFKDHIPEHYIRKARAAAKPAP